MRSPARREAPSLFGEAHHLFGVVHSPVRRSAPSVRRERLSQTQCRNGCEIKKKCELVAGKRIENLIYTRAVLRCNGPASNSSAIAPPASSVLPATSQLPRRPGQHLPDGAPPRRTASSASATVPRPAAPPQRCPGQQHLRNGAPTSSTSATAPRPATNLTRRRKVLRFG